MKLDRIKHLVPNVSKPGGQAKKYKVSRPKFKHEVQKVWQFTRFANSIREPEIREANTMPGKASAIVVTLGLGSGASITV